MKINRAISLIAAMILLLTPASASDSAPNAADELYMLAPASAEWNVKRWTEDYRKSSGNTIKVEYVENMEDYVTRLNTEVTAGEGPDIFWSVGIPYWEYGKRGVVMDIMELIENDPDISADMFEQNILQPLLTSDGKLYSMPVSYMFYAMYINDALLERYDMTLPVEWTWKAFFETCAEFTSRSAGDPNVYATADTIMIYQTMIAQEILAATDFENGKIDFDSLDLTMYGYGKQFGEVSNIVNPQSDTNSIFDNHDILFSTVSFFNANVWWGPAFPVFDSDDISVRTVPRTRADMEPLYYIDSSFCINQATDKAAQAWDFLKFVTEARYQFETFQTNSPRVRNPINIETRELRLEECVGHVKEKVELVEKHSAPGAEIALEYVSRPTEELIKAAEEYEQEYRTMRDSLGKPYYLDFRVMPYLYAPAESGNIDVEKIRSDLENTLGKYLGEAGGDTGRGYTVIYILLGVAAVAALAVVIIRYRRKITANPG